MNANCTVTSLIGNKDYVKCPRCWKYHQLLLNFDSLCDTCCQTLMIDHPEHESIVHIKESYAKQNEYYRACNV